MRKKRGKKFLFKCRVDNKNKNCCHKCGGCGYFLGFIGALVYYIQTSTGFWNTILGILKAIVWPAMLVYKLLGI